MTKVAQILYSGLGGHASVVFSMLEADGGEHWESSLGFLGIEPLANGFAEFCTRHAVPYVYFPAVARKPWKNWRAILRWLRSESPELVILHNASAIVPTWWYSRSMKVRIVLVEHTPVRIKSMGEWLFTVLAMLGANRIVTLTPEQESELRRVLGPLFSKRKARLIPNGINTIRYAPRSAVVNAPRQEVRLGMAGRFTPVKRHDCLVSMMAHLRARRPDIKWQLSLAGEGVTWQQVKAQVAREHLEDCVELPGMLTQNEVVDWYLGIDLYIHVAHAETLSTAILQAMAVQLPIVATDEPGIRNLLAPAQECGVLVDGFEPEHYAEAVIGLVEESHRARDLARNARMHAVEAYGHHAMFQKYAALGTTTPSKKQTLPS